LKENKMKVGVVGSRRRISENDAKLIYEKIIELNPSEIISGGCKKGADFFAEVIAEELNIPIKIFRPNMKKGMNYFQRVQEYFRRNKLIAQRSDKLIAAVAKDRTGGTENTIKHFLKCNNENNLIII
jgi:predicted Rossmann fold nucleotide-binding protein DprA/Smf involved in DNA uptake